MKTKLYLAMAVVVAAASMPMQATVLLGNTMPANETAFVNYSSTVSYAIGFTTPAGPSVYLTSVRIDAASTGTPALNIYNNSASQPGSLFASLTGVNALNIWTFTGAATFAPSTTYWAVVTGSGAASAWYGNDAAYSGTGTYFGKSTRTTPVPGTWGAFVGNSPSLEVNVTAVPEPGEYAMVAGLALVGFAILRRRMTTQVA